MNEVRTESYVDFLPALPENSVDLILIDPPYDIDYCDWDGAVDYELLNMQFKRILKPTGNLIVFAGWSNVCNIVPKFDSFYLKNWIIYDRIKGRGAKRNLVSTREDLLWFVDSTAADYTFNKIPSTIKKKTGGMGLKNGSEFRALSNVWTDISPIVPWSVERVNHPTQKPLQLADRIVNIFSNENDVILDCFCGSGTFLVSAKQNNRRYIGCDNNSDYTAITKQRLARIGFASTITSKIL